MAYRAVERTDRWKAITAAVAATGIIGAGILTGLTVEMIEQAVDRLETFDISLPEIPPPEPPPPPPQRQKAEEEEAGAPAAPKASPIVAPKPEVQLPTPQIVAAAREAGTGSSSSAGQGGAGTGTGAGGSGSGSGRGSGAGFTPAQRVSKIPDSEYRRFVSVSGIRNGRVGITVKVDTSGRATNCRVIQPSGSAAADSLMCQLTERYVRFRPARDPEGRAVAQDISWYPNWSPR